MLQIFKKEEKEEKIFQRKIFSIFPQF